MIARSFTPKTVFQQFKPWLVGAGIVIAAAGCKEPAANTTTAPGSSGASANANAAPAYDANQAEIMIGEYGSLTGSTATFGKSSDNGVQMATDEINKAGGILGKQVKVIVVDDSSKPEQAASAALKLINQDKVLAIIGEVASSRSLAAAPICQKSGVPMLSPSSTNPQVTQVGDYIFSHLLHRPVSGHGDVEVRARYAQSQKRGGFDRCGQRLFQRFDRIFHRRLEEKWRQNRRQPQLFRRRQRFSRTVDGNQRFESRCDLHSGLLHRSGQHRGAGAQRGFEADATGRRWLGFTEIV